MKAKKLLDFADELELVNRAEFYMECWKQSNCKTVACAVGWYCTFHPRSKLKLRLYGDEHFGIQGHTPFLIKNGVQLEDFYAVAEHFGLRGFVAEQLFTTHHNHTTPKQVAKNIRRFVNKNILPGERPYVSKHWHSIEDKETLDHIDDYQYWENMKAAKAEKQLA